ncbi:hypothetical protein Poli38472_009177 [Pythium oligandrum]|uniref:Tyrosine specific protein phosphatases domain-containing protein n=1 Tax=Pythium oligandrum TaxID=41045 RepID=A0A8K1FII1_PYTOL|nr:hypothetical protein Poli38472_009177 [Pythium oligandrum]|eukprot:TMW65010.1 hypothetical protein Poli38472_009177 [Pythium oligandrum]
MENLRFFISLWHLTALRAWDRRRKAVEEEDEATLTEFEMEFQNMHELLMNPHLRAIRVVDMARVSLARYVSSWPQASETSDLWWQERKQIAQAAQTNLLMVVPGVWIGSHVTVERYKHVAVEKGIKHIIQCTSTKPDADDDFKNGAQHARKDAFKATATRYPIIERCIKSNEHVSYSKITLLELGRMEFLVRRRDKTLVDRAEEFHAVVEFLSEVLMEIQSHQLRHLNKDAAFLSRLDGIMLHCDSGFSTSIAVCAALLMTRYYLPFDLAMRLINAARQFVSPTAYMEHCLRAYEAALRVRRHNQPVPLHQFDLGHHESNESGHVS